MRRLAGLLALVMVITMISVPVFVTEAAEDSAGAEENYVLVDEDFSEDKGLWTLEGSAKIADGKLIVSDGDSTTENELSRATLDTEAMKIEGKWYLTFDMMMNGFNTYYSQNKSSNPAQMICSVGKPRKYVDAYWRADRVFNTWSGSYYTSWSIQDGETWEYIFEFINHDTCKAWCRKKGTEGWTFLSVNNGENPGLRANASDAERANNLRFFSTSFADGTHAHIEVDNVRISKGVYAGIESLTVEDGMVNTQGVFRHGNPNDTETKSLSLITAVYDKRGYTAAINEKRYAGVTAIPAGGETVLTDALPIPEGVTEPKAATMLWSSGAEAQSLGVGAEEASRNTSTGKPAEGQEEGLTYTLGYNEVRIQGFLGYMEPRVTASLVNEEGRLCAAVETIPNREGMVDMILGINPELPAGNYTIQIRYGTTVMPPETVALHTETDVNFQSLAKEEMQTFLENFSTREKVDGAWTSQIEDWLAEDDFAEEVYDRFAAAENYEPTFDDLYNFRDVLEPVIMEEINERTRLKDINAAADPNTGNWDTLRTLLTDTYKDELFIPISDLAGIKDEKELFMRMLKGPFGSDVEVLSVFNAAVSEQKAKEAGGGGVGGTVAGGFVSGTGGGFGGGAAGGGFGGSVAVEKEPETTTKPAAIEEVVPFSDLEGYDWAKASIEALQKKHIISGDGDGNFYPDRGVTREEFLKMAMQAAGMELAYKEVPFEDVDPTAWYFGYVSAAYHAGVITGQDENTFGIGQQISRADMAVILKRILDFCGVGLDALQPAFIFDDFDSIPKYARDSITDLCRAKLMQGVGDNRFDAGASATRAEAAVAIQRIYEYIAERR